MKLTTDDLTDIISATVGEHFADAKRSARQDADYEEAERLVSEAESKMFADLCAASTEFPSDDSDAFKAACVAWIAAH